MDEREEHIRHRAHELWDNEGKPEGREMDFWLRAERELDGKSGQGGSEALDGASPPPATS